MKRSAKITRMAWSCVIAVLVVGPFGCARQSLRQAPSATSRSTPRLSASAAAALAAGLANDECERLYQKRPFTAEQHPAVLKANVYHWGKLDPGGPSGLSAVVTFRADGSEPNVQIYFSTDQVRAR